MRRVIVAVLGVMLAYGAVAQDQTQTPVPAQPEPQATASSPFGAPSKPLTAEELQAIKREAQQIRRARAEAARRAEERRKAKEAQEQVPVKQEPVAAPTPSESKKPEQPEPVAAPKQPTDPYAAPVTGVDVTPQAPATSPSDTLPEVGETALPSPSAEMPVGDELPAVESEMPALPPIEELPKQD